MHVSGRKKIGINLQDNLLDTFGHSLQTNAFDKECYLDGLFDRIVGEAVVIAPLAAQQEEAIARLI